MTDRIILKRQALERISGVTPSPYAVTLVFMIISWVVNLIIGKLNEPISQWYLNSLDYYARTGYTPGITSIVVPSWLFSFVLGVLLQIVTVGYLSYALGIARKRKVGFENLGDGFYRFWKLFGIFILTGIFTFLWSVLFIIPGIVAQYRYRLAYYIALDRPELGVLDCIRESKRLMHGYKADLFILDLSFLGWYLLGGLTFGILLIWKLPYIEVTYALFYQALAYPYWTADTDPSA